MGRRASPLQVIQLAGRTHLTKQQIREREAREEAIRPATDKVKPPKWLSNEAKKVFREVVKLYAHTDPPLITNGDVEALARYADAVVRYREISTLLAQEGYIVDSSQGPKKHPLLGALKDYERTIERGERSFGLDPSSRAGLAIPRDDDKPKDAFAARFGS